MGRIGISCLFPASWHFSISPVGCPRILNTNLRQIIVISLLAAAVSLLYFSVVIIRNKYGRLSKDKKFQRYLARVTDIEATDTNNPNVNYGIVVDCGSSGSRIFVYCWPRHNGNPHDLLDIRQMRDKNRKPVVMKIKPGISEFATSPEKVSDYISPLLNFAAEHVPRAKHKETPLYILCTAGMRILPESQQKAILEDLLTDIPVHFDFLFSDSHAEVISGKQEGVYAWIGINFVLGRFEHIEDDDEAVVEVNIPGSESSEAILRKRTAGILDMGGVSTQIAYEVPKTVSFASSQQEEVAKNLLAEFNLGCDIHQTEHVYRVYVATFLGFGGNAARQRYEDRIFASTVQKNRLLGKQTGLTPDTPYLDPCLPLDIKDEIQQNGQTLYLRGTGDFDLCRETIQPFMNKTNETQTSLNGVYQPPIHFQNSEFYGFSEFYYCTEDVLRMGGDYDATAFTRAAKDYCATKWSILRERFDRGLYASHADLHRLKYQCFKSAWMFEVFHRGFSFPVNYRNLKTALQVYDKEVQWTLGAILYRTRFLPLRKLLRFGPERQVPARVRSPSPRTGMERRGSSCLCRCLALLALLPTLSLAQYESWRHYPEYFQEPAPEYHRPEVPSDVAKIQLRLAGQKRKHSEGRVEVYYDGQWGTVCDDDFTIHAAHVVCRELGYVEAKSWTASSSYGKGEGPIWLDNVYCTGSEATLAACSSNGWGVTDCKHTEDVGVVCSEKRIPGFKFDNSLINNIENMNIQVEDIRIRAILSAFRKRTPVTEGYVEVKEGKTWKQICDKHWTAKNSRVVCGMFGFPGEKTYNTKVYKMFAARKKQRYWPYSMDCTGTEAHISSCKLGPQVSLDPVKNVTCENGLPAVVSCVPGQVFSPDGPSRFRKAYKPEQPLVRLRGGANVGEGRVEVLKNGEWGTVCDDKWDLVSASVVCRELGFGSAKEAITGSRLGQGIGPIHLNEIECTGNEKSIIDCKFNAESQGCNHEEDAAVRCNIPAMGFQKKLRLNGGRNPYEGRVEVLVERNGSLVWGMVCGENWGIVEAMVVCRQLGLGFASNAFQETWYWHGNINANKVVMSGVKCSGTELSLAHCRHDGEDVACPEGGVRYGAGVACSETAPDLVLNAEIVQQSTYLEDRPMFMLQCAMEENCLSASAAQTNPTTGYRRLLRFSSQIHNNGQSDFRPKNGRHAWIWHDCHRHYHSMEVFTHYDLLNLNGTKVAEGHKASFCLEDTECEGDIQKSYECANFGEQGITMGCWDMYRHDIDCQWVDITDVPPGDYLFQVVINPNYEVAESDYTNNIMKCRTRYDGHRIWMYNCHIGGSFSEETEKKFEHFSGLINNQVSKR